MLKNCAILSIGMSLLFLQPVLSGASTVAAWCSTDKDIVVFNVSNNKYHARTCMWAHRCTKNCIDITRAEAHKRGGIPCKVCNGGEE